MKRVKLHCSLTLVIGKRAWWWTNDFHCPDIGEYFVVVCLVLNESEKYAFCFFFFFWEWSPPLFKFYFIKNSNLSNHKIKKLQWNLGNKYCCLFFFKKRVFCFPTNTHKHTHMSVYTHLYTKDICHRFRMYPPFWGALSIYYLFLYVPLLMWLTSAPR